MADIKSILVNGKTYKVQKLDVLETIYLHAEVLHSLGNVLGGVLDKIFRLSNKEDVPLEELGSTLAKVNPEVIKKLAPQIFKQVITPKNEFLGDAVAIQAWFSQEENKADVWEVLVKAADVLVGEYLPDFLKKLVRIEKKPEE